MKGKQNMWTHLAAAVVPTVVTEVVDRVTKYFQEEKVTKRSYDRSPVDNKVRKAIRDDFNEWNLDNDKMLEGQLLLTQEDFTKHVNQKYGFNKSKTTIVRMAKGD